MGTLRWRSGPEQKETRSSEERNSATTRASQHAGEEGGPFTETDR